MNHKTSENHREFTRVDIKIQAEVQALGRGRISTGVQDVSMKGLFIKGQTDWPLGTECEVRLILEGGNPPVDIEVKGRVQRITEEGIALLFTEVGLEAYEHLHNLVMLNSDDPDKVEREFDNHLGLKKK